MYESLVVGWNAIHKLFCDPEGKPVVTLSTLQQTYGEEMLRCGAIFRVKVGRNKNVRICGWPTKIMEWWMNKHQQEWVEKNTPHPGGE